MGERIDQFCENLRVKLTAIDKSTQALKAKIDRKAQSAEQDVRAQLDAVKKRIEQNRSKLIAAQSEVKKWADERKAIANEKIADWKAKREKARLQDRADGAQRYAAMAAFIALAAMDEAEQASLEAWLARQDAEAAQSTKAA